MEPGRLERYLKHSEWAYDSTGPSVQSIRLTLSTNLEDFSCTSLNDMKLTAFVTALVALPVALAATVSVSFDQVYDGGSNSLDTVACSTGPNGLITKGK